MLRPRLWKCIERLPGLSAPGPGWCALLGEDLYLITQYLRPTDRLAQTIPCAQACTPGCRRRVVCHGPDDCVAICPEGESKYAVAHTDLIIQKLDVPAFGERLGKMLGLSGHVDPVQGLHHTWLLGHYLSRSGTAYPVYLMIQQDPALAQMAVMQLCLCHDAPFALLVPTTSALNDLARRAIESCQSAWIALDKTIYWSVEGKMHTDLNLANIFVRGSGDRSSPAEAAPPPPSEGQVVIERREMADGIHWFVDGTNKGVFYKRRNSIRANIIEILFNQISNGYVPHKTFINVCGWTEGHYFGKGSDVKVIQKHLTDIRNFLGLEVQFRIESGVRFGDNIVKSGK